MRRLCILLTSHLSGSYLAATSADNTVGIINSANFEDTSGRYHNNNRGGFREVWGWDDSCIFIGNVKGGVDVISCSQRRTIVTLQSPHITAIPCRFDAHPYNVGLLAGASRRGHVYIWTSN
ncbi:protein with unknown function [Ricinus communis]|uniref:Uncharacterized protein n=1 Tax=Ricinus communis TaxID=3988 RepID=B9SC08_RICCO|nr:protein with unknown function [Ricinus communis]